MASHETLNEPALAALVNAFYARVRIDPVLADVFGSAIADGDWPAHLGRMAAFWSSVMLSSGRYHGHPVPAHLKHREAIAPEMFARWLALWAETARTMLSSADADAVIAKAERIAESLQLALFFRLPASAPRAA
ncbi:MAG: group III truncated hemoglobin [Sphingomonadales bacterium]|nr:group III truncated hemoglobin [Sphingomonadales bacterium]MDE2171244.1 group III truncated hemoglobin [Sphingomonadales bacterium]